MKLRPQIFVSAVTKELKISRQLVADTLHFLGYEPVSQDIFGTEQGDLRDMLRKQIDGCKGVLQLVGRCYGAEPPAPDKKFRRVSYTQYEALYAQQRGKKVWYLLLDENFPVGTQESEPDELRELQAAYRRRLQTEPRLYYSLASREALEASVLKLRDDLTRLRRGMKQWGAAVIVLLVVLIGAVVWLQSGQLDLNRKLDKLLREGVTWYPEVEARIRQEQPEQNAAEAERRTYEQLAKQLGVDAKLLQEKLSPFAQELQHAPDATTYERANAAYVIKDYALAFDAYVQLANSEPAKLEYHRRIEECARLGRLEISFLHRYLTLVQQQPTNAIFYNYLGNAYLMIDPMDKDGKGRESYESALRLAPQLSPPLANLGILAYRSGKSDQAESFFNRYLAAVPDDPQGWVNLGLLYVARMQADKPDAPAATQAENALRKAIQFDPSSASAYKGLGRLCAATNRKKEALNAYQRSLALNFEQPEVRQQVKLLAWESSGARFPGLLTDDFKTRGQDTETTDAPPALIVMQLLDQGKFQQAEATCVKWAKLEPDNLLAWRLLGRACERQGHADDARRAFARIETLLKPGNQ